MSGNNKERDKSARELGIFLEFARVASLNIDPASVQSEKPPKPDINCKIGRQIHFLELAEITDNGVAHSLAIALKEMRPAGGAFSQVDPLIRTFLSKANKGYEVGAHSLGLLAYYDKQYPPIDAAAFIQAHVGGIAESMRVFGRDSFLGIRHMEQENHLGLSDLRYRARRPPPLARTDRACALTPASNLSSAG